MDRTHRRVPRCLRLLLLALLASAASFAGAEESSRPRVGLVLSGGGARGAAHVGVLKVLERERIPVDFVVGTSMGAIVGALYAAGVPVETIEEELRTMDWAEAFDDRPPRERIPFRRKRDDERSFIDIEFGVGPDGFEIGSGLIAGQNFEFMLKEFLLHTTATADFDGLPIPFRAVAADVNTGEVVVIERGDLADAIRASMAVPGAFTPIELDGRLLVDGGVLMNLPVEVALDAGMTRVIAVDVSTPLRTLGMEPSAFDVAMQAFAISSAGAREEQRALLDADDLLIVPELSDVKTADFGLVALAMGRGEAAAEAALEGLRDFALSPEAYAAHVAERPVLDKEALSRIVLDEVQFRGVKRVDTRMVRARLDTEPGTTLDLEALREDLAEIYEIGEFEKVGFRLVTDEGERKRLVIDAKEKPWGPRYLRFGLELESDFEGTGLFSAVADFRWTQIGRLGAEWKSELSIGSRSGLRTELYQPLDYRGRFFLEGEIGLERSRFDAVDPRVGFGRIDSDRRFATIDLGVNFSNFGELRAGVLYAELDADVIGVSGFATSNVDIAGWAASTTFDQLDHPYFPRRGFQFQAGYFAARRAAGSDDSYDRLETLFVGAVTHRRNTFITALSAGSPLGSDIPFYSEFRLGGFMRLSGLGPGSVQGDVYVNGALIYVRQLADLSESIGGGFYAGASIEAGNAWPDKNSVELDDLRYSGSVFLGADTFFGPIYLGYGRADGGEDTLFLQVGVPIGTSSGGAR